MRRLVILAFVLTPTAMSQTCVVERLSVDANGLEADGISNQAVMTPDGRFVAFVSTATNLVPGDTNGVADVFLRDIVLGTIERVSVGAGGVECNQLCSYPAISDDGRYVAFNTGSATLDATDTNNTLDVYLRDRVADTIERISLGTTGNQGDGPSFGATLSGDGRYVLYTSWAGNLVPGDTNATRDVFLRDNVLGTIERISISTLGVEGDNMSGSSTLRSFLTPDGRFVVFGSLASNLASGDTNNDMDVFVRDRVAGTTTFLVQALGGGQPNGFTDVYSMTGNGRFVGLVSDASNLVAGDTNSAPDAFLFDRQTGVLERVSLTDIGAESAGSSWAPVISEDGRFILFSSASNDIAPPDTNDRRDIFRRDRFAARTERFIQPFTGWLGAQEVASVAQSAAGDRVAFAYAGDDLAPGDANGFSDVFVSACTVGRVFCSGDGTASACPCGNVGQWNGGCANSSTPGAKLSGQGMAHTTDDTLALFVTGLPPQTTVAFLMGSAQLNGDAGSVFGDGLRCVGGTVTPLAKRYAADGTASWGTGVPGAPLLSLQSNVPLGGDVRWYQAWYRNPSSFCTTVTHNLSNGLEVGWVP